MLSVLKKKKAFSVLFRADTEEGAALPAPQRDRYDLNSAQHTDATPCSDDREGSVTTVDHRCQRCGRIFQTSSKTPSSAFICRMCVYPICKHCCERMPSTTGKSQWRCSSCAEPMSIMRLLEMTSYGTQLAVRIIGYCDARSERVMKSFFPSAALHILSSSRATAASGGRPSGSEDLLSRLPSRRSDQLLIRERDLYGGEEDEAGTGAHRRILIAPNDYRMIPVLQMKSINQSNRQKSQSWTYQDAAESITGSARGAKKNSGELARIRPATVRGLSSEKDDRAGIYGGKENGDMGPLDDCAVTVSSSNASDMRVSASSSAMRSTPQPTEGRLPATFEREPPSARTAALGARLVRTEGNTQLTSIADDANPSWTGPSAARSESPPPRFPSFTQFLGDQHLTVRAEVSYKKTPRNDLVTISPGGTGTVELGVRHMSSTTAVTECGDQRTPRPIPAGIRLSEGHSGMKSSRGSDSARRSFCCTGRAGGNCATSTVAVPQATVPLYQQVTGVRLSTDITAGLGSAMKVAAGLQSGRRVPLVPPTGAISVRTRGGVNCGTPRGRANNPTAQVRTPTRLAGDRTAPLSLQRMNSSVKLVSTPFSSRNTTPKRLERTTSGVRQIGRPLSPPKGFTRTASSRVASRRGGNQTTHVARYNSSTNGLTRSTSAMLPLRRTKSTASALTRTFSTTPSKYTRSATVATATSRGRLPRTIPTGFPLVRTATATGAVGGKRPVSPCTGAGSRLHRTPSSYASPCGARSRGPAATPAGRTGSRSGYTTPVRGGAGSSRVHHASPKRIVGSARKAMNSSATSTPVRKPRKLLSLASHTDEPLLTHRSNVSTLSSAPVLVHRTRCRGRGAPSGPNTARSTLSSCAMSTFTPTKSRTARAAGGGTSTLHTPKRRGQGVASPMSVRHAAGTDGAQAPTSGGGFSRIPTPKRRFHRQDSTPTSPRQAFTRTDC